MPVAGDAKAKHMAAPRPRAPQLAREYGTNERDALGDALMSVLAEQAIALRNQYPEVFAKVDAIKAQPNRQAQHVMPTHQPGEPLPYYLREKLGMLTENEKAHRRARERKRYARKRAS